VFSARPELLPLSYPESSFSPESARYTVARLTFKLVAIVSARSLMLLLQAVCRGELVTTPLEVVGG
jgi:hypothetical protein